MIEFIVVSYDWSAKPHFSLIPDAECYPTEHCHKAVRILLFAQSISWWCDCQLAIGWDSLARFWQALLTLVPQFDRASSIERATQQIGVASKDKSRLARNKDLAGTKL